ncbi:unnamed protein product [Echinostoma caproni]|uniref:SOCS box domain-containing protein n=1 Tax=Echinostoma caproni TaxID=27848 RepID=A0A183AWC9_9TREM|nr:unnamed protein product [Echinostoma caproni]
MCLQDQLSPSETQSHFNPPYGSHRGGVYLRLSIIGPDYKHSIDNEALWAQIWAPEFMPEAFLALLESRFQEARITGQLFRYHKLLSAIPRDMLINFRDIYMNIPAHNPYDVLKEALLRRMVVFEEKRI